MFDSLREKVFKKVVPQEDPNAHPIGEATIVEMDDDLFEKPDDEFLNAEL